MKKYIRFTFNSGIKHTMSYLFYLKNKVMHDNKYKGCIVNTFFE